MLCLFALSSHPLVFQHELGWSCMVVMASSSEHGENSSELSNEELDRIPMEGNSSLLDDTGSNDSIIRGTDRKIDINLQEEDPASKEDKAVEPNIKSLRMSPEQLHPVSSADDRECLQQPPVVSDYLLQDTAKKHDEMDTVKNQVFSIVGIL